jgi:hypothetical protein
LATAGGWRFHHRVEPSGPSPEDVEMGSGVEAMRLAWAAMLLAAPLAATYRLARRFSSPLESAADALLGTYLIQYLCVGICGILGILSAGPITILAAIFCAAIWRAGRGPRAAGQPLANFDKAVVLAALYFALGYIGGVVYIQRAPPLATDTLVYHLPAAVQWLQHQRIDLFQTWFFNPANTYSPLAGSMFITWLLAPMGNDSLARFVEIGPLLLVFFCVLQIGRGCGAKPPLAALLALAAILSRPLLVECTLAQDDIFVAAFFAVVVANLSADRLKKPMSEIRLGIALGLLLATKYTVFLAMPMLLITIDAPFRAGWRWRRWISMLGIVAILAGPWYLRNWIDTGNPIFPTRMNLGMIRLPGLFSVAASDKLSAPNGVWQTLSADFYSLPSILWPLLGAVWMLALIRPRAAVLSDPVRRIVLLGPLIGLIIFIRFSPYAEVRFLMPAMVLLFASGAIALRGRIWLQACALAILVAAIGTSFPSIYAIQIAQCCAAAAAVTIAGICLWRVDVDFIGLRRGVPVISVMAGLVAIALSLNNWSAYLIDYRASVLPDWKIEYGSQAEIWEYVQTELPPAATVAYANDAMVYPLYGFDYSRRVIYAPLQRGLSIEQLHYSREPLSGEQIDAASAIAPNISPDRQAWPDNLRAQQARFLVIFGDGSAPEASLAASDPNDFHLLYQTPAGAIFALTQTKPGSQP